MADAYIATSETIGTLLSSMRRERIVVPPFQRGYMWQQKHVRQFWKDITRFQLKRPLKGEPDQYFLGPIVTLTKPKEEVISLLDGQQRLATATILFSVIRELAAEVGTDAGKALARDIQTQLIERGPTFSLELGETDNIYFRETVQMSTPTNRKPTLRTHHNIRTSRRVLGELVRVHVGQLHTPAAIIRLQELRQTLISDLVMARIPVSTEQDAFQIFETLNDRGLKLQAPDLLLNFLMREAPEDDRKDIRTYWTEMIQRMGSNDINQFLRHIWVSKYGDLKDKDLFTALKEHIETSQLGSKAFASACADECESYVQLLTVDDEHFSKDALVPLKRLVQDLGVPAALPLLLAAHRVLKPADFAKVVRFVLVFYTRYSIISNLDRGDMEDLLFALARDLRALISDPTDAAASRNSTTRLKEMLASNAPTDISSAAANLNFDEDSREARYVIMRLAEYIQDPSKEISINEANLEHIYPQHPEPDEWGGEANQALMNEYLWHIGNLTIYGTRMNRKAANSEFATKRQQYLDKSKVEMTLDVARNYSEWTKDAIVDRGSRLAKKIGDIWNFDNSSRV